MRLTNFHIVVSSFAAIAGVAIAGYQAFAPSPATQPPLNVMVALDDKKDTTPANLVVEKQDVVPALATEAIELGEDATVAAALKDGSDQRYDLVSLFDGQPGTFLTIAPPDTELNVLVTFRGSQPRPVTAIAYTPPPGSDPSKLAATVDVMVLPEGQIGAAGRPVMSFSLQQSLEPQTFPIPGRAEGRGLWLRVAGAEGAENSVVGDFRILSERLAP